MSLDTVLQREMTVEPNPLLPGAYLVQHPVNVRAADDSESPRWVLVLPTHRGRWCTVCAQLDCYHGRAVSQYVEAARKG
ncbi:MAG: hypothetical protein C4551_10225 [Bacillota bacterium]|jgi:hypothetical protein|nr:MAG: hypothetical protein C4551_10225 [Bacillota bacterium]